MDAERLMDASWIALDPANESTKCCVRSLGREAMVDGKVNAALRTLDRSGCARWRDSTDSFRLSNMLRPGAEEFDES